MGPEKAVSIRPIAPRAETRASPGDCDPPVVPEVVEQEARNTIIRKAKKMAVHLFIIAPSPDTIVPEFPGKFNARD
jgi:hypothetical protein